MAIFNNFPYVNYHEKNLDSLQGYIKSLEEKAEAAQAAAEAAQAAAEAAAENAAEAAEAAFLAYANEHIDNFLMVASYIESTKTIVMAGA